MRRISVFCGSGKGNNPLYTEAARAMGQALIQNSLGLVFGGGGIGLMGEIAREVLAGGGEVIGVIPKALFEKEVALTSLKDLRVVNSMHERKALMAELSDGFIAMPGGMGTIEEIFEVLTWAQLGIHHKPCGFFNVAGYYDHLIAFLDHAKDSQFVKEEYRSMVIINDDPQKILQEFESYVSPKVDKAKWALGMKNS